MRLLPLFAAAIALMTSTQTFAQPGLQSSAPAANARAANVRSLSLVFSEPVDGANSGIDLVMTGMPGMANHQPMKVSGFLTKVSPDGRTMAVTLPRALPAGSYDLKWHVATAQGQRSEGGYSFSVR